MDEKYILNEKGEPVVEPDIKKWGEFFSKSDKRRVANETIDGVRISTVFLGIDHSYDGGCPLLWETMTFCEGMEHPELNELQERCGGNFEDARIMHAKMKFKILDALIIEALGKNHNDIFAGGTI